MEQQAQRMHSYIPSNFLRSSFDCRCVERRGGAIRRIRAVIAWADSLAIHAWGVFVHPFPPSEGGTNGRTCKCSLLGSSLGAFVLSHGSIDLYCSIMEGV